MERSYPYSRRLARRTQLQKRLAGVAALGLAGCAILYAMKAPAPVAAPAATTRVPALASADTAPAGTLKPGQRRVYPYSIVPGGVADAKELGRVIREDKVVAAHYAEFDLSRAHEKTVTVPRAVHVSYRKGDKVYWTAKKVMLAEGETLLSDGIHEARARCANQISDTPRLPVEAHGPSAEELDSSVVENDAALADGFENVSMGMPAEEDEGVRGGFLHAAGNGSAGGVLAGGGALESRSLFAAAGTAGAPDGAFLAGRSGSSRAAPGKGSEQSSSGGGSSGGSGGAPSGSAPAAGTPGSGESSGTPGATPGTTQPGTPGTPGQPAGGNGPATPSQPGGTSPAAPDTPDTPEGGQSGGGGAGPSLPPSDIGGDPDGSPQEPVKPETGPDDSPVPPPTLEPPQEPLPPGQQPSQPAEIPEPGSAWLVTPLLALMLLLRRRRR
jgi:hypothetical protein